MFRKSLPSILAGFNKTLAQLEKLIESNNRKKDEVTNQILVLQDDRDALAQEAQQAFTILNNLKTLLGK